MAEKTITPLTEFLWVESNHFTHADSVALHTSTDSIVRWLMEKKVGFYESRILTPGKETEFTAYNELLQHLIDEVRNLPKLFAERMEGKRKQEEEELIDEMETL